MKDIFMRIRRGIQGRILTLKKNLILLFIVAIILGGILKVGASRFIVIGYNDYLIERHNGFDFVKMKQEVTKRNQEAQQKQEEQGGSDADVPVAACGV